MLVLKVFPSAEALWTLCRSGSSFPTSKVCPTRMPTTRGLYTHPRCVIFADWEGTGVEPDVKVEASQALDVATKLALERIKDNADKSEPVRLP